METPAVKYVYVVDANHQDGYAAKMTEADFQAWKDNSDGDAPTIVPEEWVKAEKVIWGMRYRLKTATATPEGVIYEE
jgi:hypothetical protein